MNTCRLVGDIPLAWFVRALRERGTGRGRGRGEGDDYRETERVRERETEFYKADLNRSKRLDTLLLWRDTSTAA